MSRGKGGGRPAAPRPVVFTVVPAPDDPRPPLVFHIDDEAQVPAMQRKAAPVLDRPGAVGITTDPHGNVLMLITDDGCAVLDPEVNEGLRRDINRLRTAPWN